MSTKHATTNTMPDASRAEIRPAELLLVLPLAVRVVDGQILYDLQSRDSLKRFLNSFETAIVALPRLAESRVAALNSYVWVPVDDLLDRVQFIPLPEFGSPWKFFRDYGPTVTLLRRCIEVTKYNMFAIGGGNCGLEHDWAAVAAEQAIRAGRKFSLLIDVVSYECFRQWADADRRLSRLPRRLKTRLWGQLVRLWQGRLVSRCDLIFCNGMTTFEAYSPFCRSPEVPRKIHDFQIGPEKYLDDFRMERKCQEVRERTDLRVCYAGRVEPSKAPLDWVRAIREACDRGASIKAVWMGAGSLMEAMRQEVDRLGLGAVIELPGFVSDRDRVVETQRESDLMMFTHIEPESPRVLIEALMSACPIVGYDNSHPANLISVHGGGVMTPMRDPQALGAALADLATDRDRLAGLVRRAWLDGGRFNSDDMSRDRCEAIRARLG
jgi:glycosyltransferase involved in cell wall biosynthesis